MSSFYSEDELKEIGFKSFGKDVLISRKASIYGAENISIGDNVRIDDFCILSGNIEIGCHCHFGAYASLFAGDSKITFDDFSGLSSYSCVYAITDDYIGPNLLGPIFPDKYRHIIKAPVKFEKYTGCASGAKIMPGVVVKEGCEIGPMSLVVKSTRPWKFYIGSPARPIIDRPKEIIEIAKKFLKEYNERSK